MSAPDTKDSDCVDESGHAAPRQCRAAPPKSSHPTTDAPRSPSLSRPHSHVIAPHSAQPAHCSSRPSGRDTTQQARVDKRIRRVQGREDGGAHQ
eukprot:2627554-Rhodomonas_salina.1